MNKIRAVIFDMDGVILDSEPIHVLAERVVLEQYGIKVDEKDWDGFKGKKSVKIFSEIINKYEIKGASAQQMANDKLSRYLDIFSNTDVKLFDGFLDAIDYLQSKYLIALTTSSHYKLQRAVFNKFKLDKYFKVVVTGDMVVNGKPNPEPYLLTISKLALIPGECAVVEDSDNGIVSAKSAGTTTVAVTHTLIRERLWRADYIIDGLSELCGIL